MKPNKNSQARFLDVTRFKLERHVEESLRTALALSEDQPMSARHVLNAALIVSRTASSPAFSKWASFFPPTDVDTPVVEQTSRADMRAVPLNSFLASAYDIAEPFFLRENAVWGRDYIAVALLAVGDPSLNEIAGTAGSSIEALRDEWFRFVTSDETHRDHESWTEWWTKAGVPLPEERVRQFARNETRREESDGTYLLTWDPKRHTVDYLTKAIREFEQQGTVVLNWSVGDHGLMRGDRVFFMRHGEETPGLIGSGHVVGDVTKGPHWDKTKPSDWTAYYADVRWDLLRELPLIPLEELVKQTGEDKLWTTPGSGLPITQGVAERLETVWKEALAAQSRPTPPDQGRTEIAVPRAWVETDAIQMVGNRSYRPSEHDSLDAKHQAEIFATLLISKDVQPPFALGLLGDWGVGKTFFMRLMQEKVEVIAGKDARTDKNSDSVSRAAQIEFNAWHYVDSDLWACLASHIFNGLSEELSGGRVKEVDEIRRRLRSTISSSKQGQEAAKAAIIAARNERQAAAKTLIEKQNDRARKASDQDRLRLKRVWEAVLKVKPDPTNPEQSNWPDLAALKTKVEDTAKCLGITDAIDSAEEAQRVYVMIHGLFRRGSGLTAALATAFAGKRAWLSMGIVLLLLSLVLSWPAILAMSEALLNASAQSVKELLGPVLQLGTILGAAAVWAGRNLRSISSAMGYLEKIRDEVRNPRIMLAKATNEETSLKADIEKLDAEIATEQRRIEEADRQIAEAQAEIQRINAGGLVYDFLAGRVSDSRYLDRLGLISIIRQDFEKLGSLLDDWQRNAPGDEDEKTPEPHAPWDKQPIERIILYIDDLDRCPPKRVVEVLQAVHLLLAFDLFVVVVAVDSRWLERSLNEAYNPSNVKKDGFPPEEPIHRFSAHNYLEKIFQIPFSLPEMDEDGYRKLVTDMIATPQAQADRIQANHLLGEKSERGQGGVAKPNLSGDDAMPTTPERQGFRVIDEKSGNRHTPGGESDLQKVEQRKREQEVAQKRIKAMLLREYEEQFVAALFHFIHTPRLAKRFVNIYRLLRVRAAEVDFLNFINREAGEYRAVLILLAINVGWADVAPEILEDLRTAEGSSFMTWLEQTLRRYEEEWLHLRTERITENKSSPSSRREMRLAYLRDALPKIRSDIEAVIKTLDKHGGPPFDDTLETYVKWVYEVGRYSFHCHIKGEG